MARFAASSGGLARRLVHQVKRLAGAASGGIGVGFALSLPVMLTIVGAASDYAVMTKIRAELQEVADAAAMAGAREIPLANSNAEQVEIVVRTFAAYRLTNNSSASEADLHAMDITLDVAVKDDFSAVEVKIREDWSPFFAHLLMKTITPVRVSSAARFVGRTNICVLGLAPTNTAVLLSINARLTGNDCGVFSNSTNKFGMRVESGATLEASMICSAGGIDQAGATIKPSALSDCPPVDDPLASRPAPAVGGCDYNDVVLTNATETLNPGVYCGGLKITGTSSATLNPGVYVIKDGGLVVNGQATLHGEQVGFYLTGTAAPTVFSSMTHISLSAPTSGPMAGLLLFEDRNLSTSLTHRITSDDARKLIGTIYLPVGQLVIDSKKPVADLSAYTAIISTRLNLNMGPNLILNSDYEATDVPVPSGIAGSRQVILSN